MDLYGKDFIVSQDWSLEELKELLDLAAKMKRDRY
ncbi:MAG: ornithine carbamoyltransferase, partial [Anaerolineae bacterium]|nr:ornithine carbamoyltransferase [Anaerolineae bacterium]